MLGFVSFNSLLGGVEFLAGTPQGTLGPLIAPPTRQVEAIFHDSIAKQLSVDSVARRGIGLGRPTGADVVEQAAAMPLRPTFVHAALRHQGAPAGVHPIRAGAVPLAPSVLPKTPIRQRNRERNKQEYENLPPTAPFQRTTPFVSVRPRRSPARPPNTGDKLRSSIACAGFVCFIPLFGGAVAT
jgi:hypothetical protein